MYSVVPENEVVWECKGENRISVKGRDSSRGEYKDPFNGFFPPPKGESSF